MVVGENGILNRATDASKKTNEAKDEEQRQFTMAEAAMNFENTIYIDPNTKEEITIPAGFAVSQVEGENTVDDGLVIIDSKGNEFVWIPVSNFNEFDNANTLSTSEGWPDWSYITGDTLNESNNDSYKAKTGWANDSEQMKVAKESVENKKGFYVARYEAGVPSNADFYVSSNSNSNGTSYLRKNTEIEKNDADILREERNVIINEDGVSLNPVSKKGNQVWNFINQINAKTLSENMYLGNSSVNSYLIDSNAWNYICKYIFEIKKGIDIKNVSKYGNYTDNMTTNYEKIKGLFAKHTLTNVWNFGLYEYGNVPSNYSPQKRENGVLELATGICDDFKIYNIYDMAGNFGEWTAEETEASYGKGTTISIEKYAVIRGNTFNNGGNNRGVEFSRGNWRAIDPDVQFSFRVVLYLK